MRLPDRAVVLKAVSVAKNPILMKRKKIFKLSSFLIKNNSASATATDGDRTRNDESIKSLRDVIAFCMLPPPAPDGAAAECFCPEKELERLVCHAVKENPYSQRLKDALIKQSWDGESFAGPVDRRLLAKDISDVVKKM